MKVDFVIKIDFWTVEENIFIVNNIVDRVFKTSFEMIQKVVRHKKDEVVLVVVDINVQKSNNKENFWYCIYLLLNSKVRNLKVEDFVF